MAQFNDVLIRSVAYLDKRDKSLVNSFLARKEKIPIYYHYCQTDTPPVNLNENNLIGYATNLHVDNGLLLCDVEIIHLLKLANNFDGTIDNFVLSINRQSDNFYTIDKFIVYDKEFKRKVDAKMNERVNEFKESMDEQENQKKKKMSVCMEIAGAESMPELGVEAPDAN